MVKANKGIDEAAYRAGRFSKVTFQRETSQSEGGSTQEFLLSLREHTSGFASSPAACLLPVCGEPDSRRRPGFKERSRLSVMSAAAAGTSRTTHGDVAARKKKGPGALATAYLVIYNVVMTAGWLVIAVGLVRAYLARGSYHGLYYSIEKPLKFFQTGALLEVLSRVFLTWAVTHSVREVRRRLLFYFHFEMYTFFFALYPMGVSGELLTIYAALPHVQKTGLYSVTLPNKYNFSFDYHGFLILAMVSYIPLFPQLYFHMIRQRKKVLGHVEDYSKVE
uniref:Very-long-chain (3R)-3-hydroxyacyl-CoA dehydratase n=1 Tax=Gasterosteus aculeatus aculeatus TaxID=481459 RepID=A0AAQ4RL31_GASAC